jgi:hypothetical protein
MHVELEKTFNIRKKCIHPVYNKSELNCRNVKCTLNTGGLIIEKMSRENATIV